MRAPRHGFTLLEMVLVLSLTGVILGLVGTAIYVQIRAAEKGRLLVDEAQLARAVLTRIAEDLRNAVPLAAKPSAASASGSSDTATENAFAGGLQGSLQCLQVDAACMSRPNLLLTATTSGGSERPTLSDVKTVTYSLGNPGTLSPAERGDSLSDSAGGLYRREMERAAFTWAMQQGQADVLNLATSLVAPEVVDLQFTYYDGETASDSWDSTQQGKLPTAIKVAIGLRRGLPQPATTGSAATDSGSLIVYDILVDLPNSQVKPSATSSQSSGGSSGKGSDTSANNSSSGNSPSGNTQSGGSSGNRPSNQTPSGNSPPPQPPVNPPVNPPPTQPTQPTGGGS